MGKTGVFTFLLSCAALIVTTGVRAHEVWLEPVRYFAPLDAKIVAQLKIGAAPKGDLLPYLPFEIIKAAIADDQGERPLTGTLGDIPAVFMAARTPGLQVITYETNAQRLTYTDPKKFPTFLKNQGLDGIAERHTKRGFGLTGFTEAYSRCSKSLVARGTTFGQDRAVGMTLELIAEANPYDGNIRAGGTLPVRLLWKGQPLADSQITVFRRGSVDAVAKVRTDPQGRAAIAVSAPGAYILNAVRIIPGHEKTSDVWHSYWASMTFKISK